MKIDPRDGAIHLPEIGAYFPRFLSRAEFLACPAFAEAAISVRNEPWCSYRLPLIPLTDTQLCIVFQFHGERLLSLTLSHVAARFGSSRADFSAEGERARQSFHDQWLANEVQIPTGDYPWGKITSAFAPTDRLSSIVITYTEEKLADEIADDILKTTEDAYLCLIHPCLQNEHDLHKIASVASLAPSAPDASIAFLINGPSWRERLIGLCLAAAKGPERFADAILESLRHPRGLSIVPACALLAILAQRGAFDPACLGVDTLPRAVFDGELGWAIDQVKQSAGLPTGNLAPCGPNDGQIFENHLTLYRRILPSLR